MRLFKRTAFGIWVIYWLSMVCYGFRIMPSSLAHYFDVSFEHLAAAGFGTWVMGYRPGDYIQGLLALIGGGALTIGMSHWASVAKGASARAS